MKVLKEKVLEQETQMKQLEPQIMKFMKDHDFLDVNTRLGNIKYKETKSKKRVTIDVLKKRLENYL